MKSYKAIVIDGKKILKSCAVGCIALIISGMVAINVHIAHKKSGFGVEVFSPQHIVEESIPVMYGTANKNDSFWSRALNTSKKALNFVLTFDTEDLRTVFFTEIPLIRSVSGGYLAMKANELSEARMVYNPQNADQGQGDAEPAVPGDGERYPIKEVDSGQAKALEGKQGKILIRNDTKFSINIDEMLKAPLKFHMKGDGPKILIVHTHATESYTPEGENTYSAEQSDRSMEADKNMICVGKAVAEVFRENGISVLHDTTLHDHPNFNGSYENSRKTVESYLAKYPSIQIVLDIHRDAFVYDDGSKAKFATEINGKKVAQLMLVVGTNAGGLEHPQWRENMKLALKFQNYISGKHPTLMRGVNLRTERFNGHTTYGSMIIEVGSSGNTITEAVEGAKYGAQAMAEFLNTLK